MKKKYILFGLVVVLILAGCSQNIGTRVSRTVEVNGQPVNVDGPDYSFSIRSLQPTTISEVIISQPENSKTEIHASVDNRLVEKNGVKVVLTTVTIEETGSSAGIPFYVWILLAIIVILTVITITACTGDKTEPSPVTEPEPEPEPAPEPEPEPVKEIEIATEGEEYVEAFIEEGKTKTKKRVPRIYGIDSLQDLVIITKNTASKADAIQQKCSELKAEIKDLNAQIRENSGDTFADEVRRERQRIVKNNKHSLLTSLSIEGRQVEISNDDYAYLLKRLTGDVSDFRKTERFAEDKVISVTQYDVVWLKKHLDIK